MEFSRFLIDVREIFLFAEEYSPSESTIAFHLTADKWKQSKNTNLPVVLPLTRAIKYSDGHICKRDLTDVLHYFMESTKPSTKCFRGLLRIQTDEIPSKREEKIVIEFNVKEKIETAIHRETQALSSRNLSARNLKSEDKPRSPKSLVDLVFTLLQRRWDVIKLIKGNPCTLQRPDSETQLHVPEGVYAIILGNTDINPSKFQNHIPKNDCLVASICEYYLQPLIGKTTPSNANYKLKVPHIIKNISLVKKSIRIRHGDIHSSDMLPMLEGNNFEIDEKYVTINASHFSGFIITAEGINYCSGSAHMKLYGSLANSSEEGPLVTVKAYLGSVSENKFSLLDRELKRCAMSLSLLTMRELFLSNSPYDASKSTVAVELTPIDNEKWTKFDHIQLRCQKPLSEALKFVDSHICKRDPTEVAQFYLESSNVSELFRGVVAVSLNIVESSGNSRSSTLREVVQIKDFQSPQSQISDLQIKDLSKLARYIQATSMKQIALELFELDPAELSNVATDAQDTWEFNFEVLNKWRNKSSESSRSNLLALMKQAADEGLVDNEMVLLILS